jgi:putative peptide zinc metalloprotease protein
MSVFDPSSQSSEQRLVRLRKRLDLVINESVFQGERSHVVKDPLALKYVRLRPPEYAVLQMLDGSHSYRQITSLLQRTFPEQKFELADVQQLVSSFHQNGLLISDFEGQALPLRKRREKELKQKAIGLLSSVIAIRFPGVDPEPFLAWAYPKVRWFFAPVITSLCIAMIVSAGMLVISNFSEFMKRLPEFQQFFGFDNLLFMALVLIVTKSIHELGHGLMCKHFGGECHEIGFMLLVMTPAMYCNTSDSWILPNKWHRIAIGAAGMYVELVLAALATFGWWYTHPGWLHYFCLNVMFLSSVSTILFNANPLLRYDGYYMLSDFLEIPNLAQKSKQAMVSKLRVWCLGMKPINSGLMPTRNQTAFAIYAIASFCYRWFVMLMIFWFLKKVFEPYGLEVIGNLLVSVALLGAVAMPAFKLFKFFAYPGRFREVKTARTVLSVVVVGVAAWAFCCLPMPHYVHCGFVVQPAEAQAMYVSQPGILSGSMAVGSRVKSGDVVAQLRNDQLELQLLELTGRLSKLRAQLDSYRVNRADGPDAERMIVESQLDIRAVEKEIELRKAAFEQLNLVADRDGVLIEAPNQAERPGDRLTLASWSGTPLDQENQGAWLKRNTLVCYVGDPVTLKAQLVISQSDIKFVSGGQQVDLLSTQNRDSRFQGAILSVSQDQLARLPRELSQTNGGPIAVQMNSMGEEVPMLTHYSATVELSQEVSKILRPGFHGDARIRVGSASLGSRLWRQILTTVNFR